jgi:lysophospholipase L1-like esterase
MGNLDLATYSGTPTYAAGSAKFGADGLATGSVLEQSVADRFLSGGSGTIEAWVRLPNANVQAVAVIAPRASTTNRGFSLYTATGHISAQFLGGVAGNNNTITGPLINDHGWHHVVIQWANGIGSLWCDGTLIGSTLGQASPTDTTFQWGIAGLAQAGNGAYVWPGDIDEVRISTIPRYTGSSYTVPSAAFTVDAYTLALYHMDGDATDATTSGIPYLTAQASITGGPVAGSTLTALTGTWGNTPTSYTYQWTRGGANIGGATGSTYTVLNTDVGNTIACIVTAVNGTGSASTIAPAVTIITTTIAPNDSNLVYSPYNWDLSSVRAMTINPGAYLRASIVGTPTAISALFDASDDTQSVLPEVAIKVDDGPWTTYTVASSIALTLPATNGWAKHSVQMVMKSSWRGSGNSRWGPTSQDVKFLGFLTSPGTCTSAAITKRALNILIYGDSITEGCYTLNNTSANTTDQDSALQGWAYLQAEVLGAEVGVVGFSNQGMVVVGTGNVPAFPSTYTLLYGSGPTRSFSSPTPDVIVINQGTNDGNGGASTSTFQANYLAALNALLVATPKTTIILAMRPFGGSGSFPNAAAMAPYIQAARAACSDPTRVFYINTTGWLDTTDTNDGLHPYGHANITALAPLLASAIRSSLAARGPLFVNLAGVATTVTPYRG